MRRLINLLMLGPLLLGTVANGWAAEPTTGTTVAPVSATLEARRTQTRGERFCTGADGLYRFALETYEGTSSGSEPVDGRFVLEVHAFDNVTQGFRGPAVGTVKIYDLATDRLKLVGDVLAVDSPSVNPPGVRVDGFVTGRVVGTHGAADGATGEFLFANFSVLLDATAAFVGNLGADGPVQPHNAAIVVDRGTCASGWPGLGPNDAHD